MKHEEIKQMQYGSYEYVKQLVEQTYGQYNVAASLNKAKKWLNQRGSQLMSGKGFQHKST